MNKYGYEIVSPEDLKDLLEVELVNSYLFASQGFISSFQAFIDSPSNETRLVVAKEMRKDLWKLK